MLPSGVRRWGATVALPTRRVLSAGVLSSGREDTVRGSRGRCPPAAAPAGATNSSDWARRVLPRAATSRRSIASSTPPRWLRSSRRAATAPMYFSSPLAILLPSSPHEMSVRGPLEFQQKLSPQRDARRSMYEWCDRLASVQPFVISHEVTGPPRCCRHPQPENWRSLTKTGDNVSVSHDCRSFEQVQAGQGRTPQ